MEGFQILQELFREVFLEVVVIVKLPQETFERSGHAIIDVKEIRYHIAALLLSLWGKMQICLAPLLISDHAVNCQIYNIPFLRNREVHILPVRCPVSAFYTAGILLDEFHFQKELDCIPYTDNSRT